MLVSIFNDVIGPVMRGASSSHCAAALRIGRLARDLMGGSIENVVVEFDRQGSLPTTHTSQGSDMGLFGGLLGWAADDARLVRSVEALQAAGIDHRFEIVDTGDKHPNTYRLRLRNSREELSLIAISTGGGMIEVLHVDGFNVSMFGDCHATLVWLTNDQGLPPDLLEQLGADQVLFHRSGNRQLIEIRSIQPLDVQVLARLCDTPGVERVRTLAPVLPVLSSKTTAVPFSTCQAMLQYDNGRGAPLWKLASEYEQARGGMSESEVLAAMVNLVRILRRSIREGIEGTTFDDRILGHQSGRFGALLAANQLLDGGALNRIILYVTAMMEVKSAMGVIIAAPTAGACAALPGAVIAMAEQMGRSEEEMARALLAAGVVGVFIATAWTFAAEVGGCQAEGGSAASMAAAALVTLAGGTLAQSLAAASMALQNMLGLICDPVANRVEVPCLGKNVLAASNALACANMALAGFDPVIPLDEVIQAAKQVAGQMPRELRCTALGGLSLTPTSQALQRRLALAQSSSCGCGGDSSCAR